MPKGYIIAELTITNAGSEFDEYRDKVLATVEAFGGRFLVRGGDPRLGPVDKPVLAPARSERLGRRDTHVATGVTN